jgi:hypothetical protein
MTDRRGFLKATGGAAVWARQTGNLPHVRTAREIVRAGSLGSVAYCRVEHRSILPVVHWILNDTDAVCEIDSSVDGAVFLGSEGTLAVSGGGCRLFARDG